MKNDLKNLFLYDVNIYSLSLQQKYPSYEPCTSIRSLLFKSSPSSLISSSVVAFSTFESLGSFLDSRSLSQDTQISSFETPFFKEQSSELLFQRQEDIWRLPWELHLQSLLSCQVHPHQGPVLMLRDQKDSLSEHKRLFKRKPIAPPALHHSGRS